MLSTYISMKTDFDNVITATDTWSKNAEKKFGQVQKEMMQL